jgi:uncharacterized protein (TIGR02217 family)
MSISDERFPEDIAYGSTGGAVFSTSIVTNAGGYEKRNRQWETARAVYNVAHGIKTKAQLDVLIAFFRASKGRSRAFRFKDWSDYQAIGELIGTGNGVTAVFQLRKIYSNGSDTDVRFISKPVEGTVQIYLGSTLQSTGFTVNYATGIVTFVAPPAMGTVIRADFEFDVPVRFETDQLAARLDEDGLYSWGDIPLVEVRG